MREQSNKEVAPQRWLSFLRAFCPPALLESIEGDLLEEFDQESESFGVSRARRRFRLNVLRFFTVGILRRNRFRNNFIPFGMLMSFLKVAWRNLLTNRTYTTINLTGLTLGVAVAILLFWIVRFEYTFDSFHTNVDRLYQIKTINKFNEPNSHVPQGAIYALRNQFQSVEMAATVYGLRPQVLRVGNTNLKGEKTFFLHPEFLKMIDVKWVAGSAEQSLRDLYSVVLDQPSAKKFFGDDDPIGKIIRYDNTIDLVVTGLIEEMPLNSEFRFGMIASYQTLTKLQSGFTNENHWGGGDSWCHGFVLVHPSADVSAIEDKLADLSKANNDDPDSFELMPIVRAHFDPYNDSFNYSVPRWILRTLASIAVFIVVIAIINFVNLATAQAAQRAREIGLRKVMGGTRRSVIIQFLSETAVVIFASVFLAGLLATRLIAFAPDFFNTQAHLATFWDTEMFVSLFALALVVTLLAGAYPALLLSGLNPVRIFRKDIVVLSGKSVSLRKSLVILQFVIAQVMVICMVVGREQMNYFYQTDLGFDTEAVVTVDMPYGDSVLLQERFRAQLLQHSEIRDVTYALTSPSSDYNWWWGKTMHPGLLNGEQTFRLQWIDHNYLSFYSIPLLAGRNFLPTDSLPFALINERAVRDMGFKKPEDALGEKLKYWGNEVTVIGVTGDYYSQGLKSEIPPHLYMNGKWNFRMAQIKIEPARFADAVLVVERYWKDLHPDNFFEYNVLSEKLHSFYEDERKFSNFVILFCVLAVVIGCLGLFGLVSFVCVRRSREISIRKVLGATFSDVISLLGKDFFVLVSSAFLIAAPLGWYLMSQFLQRYTYHVDIPWIVFPLAGCGTVLLALFTVVLRSLKTANQNPVDWLKYE